MTVDGDGAAVLLDDALDDGQAQAGAAGLGGEEGVEEVGEVLLRDAAAGVGLFGVSCSACP